MRGADFVIRDRRRNLLPGGKESLMNQRKAKVAVMPRGLEKTPTGVCGLDEITGGGLPKGRPTLVSGSAGCGKTMLGLAFLVHGAVEYGEPGVFMAFEETEDELGANVVSLGIDLPRLVARKKLCIDSVKIERNEIEETGEYDLGGLFIRLADAIDSIGAKRVVLDTIEVLFAGLTNHAIVRAELRRLFRWLKDKGVTALITAEQGAGTLTRYGLEEYVADCVIQLDQRVTDQIATRRLRVVKYRGSAHGSNEYPFLITKNGISVLPITSLGLDHRASTQRISSGIARLDTLLGGQGYYRASSILVSGYAGTGKTTLAAAFAAATCRRGERCLFVAFEESSSQLLRNMRSVGIDLEPFVKNGLLRFHATRPTAAGLESHLAAIHDLITAFQPAAVVIDPLTNLTSVGTRLDVTATLARLIDFLKTTQITMVATSLTAGGDNEEQSEVGISSLMDTWILVRNLESGGERNRGLYILKSRGMAHSNQVREFVISSEGVRLLDVYTGSGTVLTGSARIAQLERERVEEALRREEVEGKRAEIEHRRAAAAAQIEALKADLAIAERELKRLDAALVLRGQELAKARSDMARSRMGDKEAAPGDGHVH
jgi:circadian clock protein KaiC